MRSGFAVGRDTCESSSSAVAARAFVLKPASVTAPFRPWPGLPKLTPAALVGAAASCDNITRVINMARKPPSPLALTILGAIDGWRENVADVTPNQIFEALDDVRQTTQRLVEKSLDEEPVHERAI